MDSKIAFRSFGTGEPIILLHGFAGSVSHWDPLRPLLSKYYQVIVPNLTHLTLGRSALSFSDQVNEIHRFIEREVDGGPVHLVGISYGAALAWGLALRFPATVGRVVLINPMPPEPIHHFIWPGLSLLLRAPAQRLLLSLFFRTVWGRQFFRFAAETFRNVDHPTSFDRLDGMRGRKLAWIIHIVERFSWILRKEDWKEWTNHFSDWSHQTLLVYEERDPLIRYSSYEAFAQLINCEASIVTQGAGHISTLNSPHMISWEVMKFLLHVPAKPRQLLGS